jgi:bifunctional non-homologous end joining protein LigD
MSLALEVQGVRVSHPERLVYPELGITKLDLIRYYETLGDWIVPHVAGRPLTLVLCSKGVGGPCVYLRHTKLWGPSVIRRVVIREKTKLGEYMVADDLSAVIGVIQMGVVEIHTWNATAEDVERPNRIVWDLDPGPAVTWRMVIEAARELRGVLEVLGLESWVKTTGGRGLHVVTPLQPGRDWSECLVFARAVADALVRGNPRRYTTTFAKQGRESRILIDYLRNNRTNTSVSAYSTRARPGGTVSMPITWDRLSATRPPNRFTVVNLARLLKRQSADPWRNYWQARQRISAAAFKAIRELAL